MKASFSTSQTHSRCLMKCHTCGIVGTIYTFMFSNNMFGHKVDVNNGEKEAEKRKFLCMFQLDACDLQEF